MGYGLSRSINIEDEPVNNQEIFDKFKDKSRPVREMTATTEEMDAAQLPRRTRDYCAHLYMDYLKCRRDWFPQFYKCNDIMAQYQHCNVYDIKHRMLEYERTKRLMLRERYGSDEEE